MGGLPLELLGSGGRWRAFPARLGGALGGVVCIITPPGGRGGSRRRAGPTLIQRAGQLSRRSASAQPQPMAPRLAHTHEHSHINLARDRPSSAASVGGAPQDRLGRRPAGDTARPIPPAADLAVSPGQRHAAAAVQSRRKSGETTSGGSAPARPHSP